MCTYHVRQSKCNGVCSKWIRTISYGQLSFTIVVLPYRNYSIGDKLL